MRFEQSIDALSKADMPRLKSEERAAEREMKDRADAGPRTAGGEQEALWRRKRRPMR